MTRNFNSKPTTKYKEALSVLRELLDAEGEDEVTRVFAQTTYEARQRNFAKRDSLKPSTSSHICVHRLQGKRCPRDCDSPSMIPVHDHMSEWKKDGKTHAIVAQPNGMTYETLKETISFCEEYGLEVSINAWPSWHFPGSVVSVIYKQKQV